MNLQLLYVSNATEAMTKDEFKKIEASSLIFNSVNCITGLLCFDGKKFIQILEGEETLVDKLLGRLKSDKRHKDLETLYREPVRHKCYGDWAMRCVRTDVDQDRAQEIERLLAPTLPPALTILMRQFAEGNLSPAL